MRKRDILLLCGAILAVSAIILSQFTYNAIETGACVDICPYGKAGGDA